MFPLKILSSVARKNVGIVHLSKPLLRYSCVFPTHHIISISLSDAVYELALFSGGGGDGRCRDTWGKCLTSCRPLFEANSKTSCDLVSHCCQLLFRHQMWELCSNLWMFFQRFCLSISLFFLQLSKAQRGCFFNETLLLFLLGLCHQSAYVIGVGVTRGSRIWYNCDFKCVTICRVLW